MGGISIEWILHSVALIRSLMKSDFKFLNIVTAAKVR
jgi:hypothetical protein